MHIPFHEGKFLNGSSRFTLIEINGFYTRTRRPGGAAPEIPSSVNLPAGNLENCLETAITVRFSEEMVLMIFPVAATTTE